MTKKKPHNVADEQQVKEQEEREKARRLQELGDVKYLLGNKRGMRFLQRLLDEGKVFVSTFTGNSETYFNEGQRALALKFMKDMQEVATPEELVKLMTSEREED